MKHDISYHIWPRDTHFEDVLEWCRQFAADRQLEKALYQGYTLEVSRFEEIHVEDLPQFVRILQVHRQFKTLSTTITFVSGAEGMSPLKFDVYVSEGVVHVGITSPNFDVIRVAHAALKEQFHLGNPAALPGNAARRKVLHATIFLGRHFDKSGNEAARTVERFLRLLRFDVIEGEPYASQPIPDKVKLGIERQDIYICLVTGRREHDWLIAESAFANGKGRHTILMVEEGSEFNPTLSGKDLEQIRFSAGQPEKAFIQLLEEFRAIGVAGLF